jgi:hypothetical protein
MLLVLSVLVGVFAALVWPLETSQRVQLRDTEYAFAQQNARTGLDSMARQIRQSYAVLSTTPNAIEIRVDLGGVDEHVLYECDVVQTGTSYRECVRVQAAAGSALPALSTGTVVIPNLLNGTLADPVFTYSPNNVYPSYVTATVKVPASGGTNSPYTHSIVLSLGVLLRGVLAGD